MQGRLLAGHPCPAPHTLAAKRRIKDSALFQPRLPTRDSIFENISRNWTGRGAEPRATTAKGLAELGFAKHLRRGCCDVYREVVGAGGSCGAEGDTTVAERERRASSGGKVVLQAQILQPQPCLEVVGRENSQEEGVGLPSLPLATTFYPHHSLA